MNKIQIFQAAEDEFCDAYAHAGGVYFVCDRSAKALKIGYSRFPGARVSNLQVGNPNGLELAGLIAAPRIVEEALHHLWREYHARGEWFHDNGDILGWLDEMTDGQPIGRTIWRTLGPVLRLAA